MHTLHLLPGESAGDTADIVLCPKALAQLETMLAEAKTHGYSMGRFRQRDGRAYSVMIDLIDKPHTDAAWRERPLAYMQHQHGHIIPDLSRRTIDSSLLSAHLYAARKVKKHDQKRAARELGLSLGFVSNVENAKTVPKAASLDKLCAYIGTHPDEYKLGGNG